MTQRVQVVVAIVATLFAAPVAAQGKDGKDQSPSRHLMSWTADRREYNVGDIVTVLVSEATLASATKSQNGSDQTTRKNDLAIDPPKIGTSALPSIDGTLSTGKNSSSKQSGDASRTTSFKGDISVRIVSVDKSGLLQVKGSKVVDVDKNKQTLNFTGWVRPEDITTDNLVASERVADAQLTYSLSGDLGKTRGGIIGRIVSVFWP